MSGEELTQLSTDDVSMDMENWMGNLPPALLNTPIIHLAIPGSHNSFSYSLSPSSNVSPDSPAVVQFFGKWCKPLANRIVYNWSVGQNLDVMTQLFEGIRYLDTRLVVESNEIYVAHGLYGGLIKPYLQEIFQFLTTHPREVIIFDFQHFYKFTQKFHEELVEILGDVFKNKIVCRPHYITEVTLENIWRKQAQVIIIYRNHCINNHCLFWTSQMWYTPWPNKLSAEELICYLDNELTNRTPNKGLVTQCVLTPTVKYVVFRLCGSLKKDLAIPCNKKIIPWIQTKTNGQNGINVIICDFILSKYYNFPKTVVSLNYNKLSLQQRYSYDPAVPQVETSLIQQNV